MVTVQKHHKGNITNNPRVLKLIANSQYHLQCREDPHEIIKPKRRQNYQTAKNYQSIMDQAVSPSVTDELKGEYPNLTG